MEVLSTQLLPRDGSINKWKLGKAVLKGGSQKKTGQISCGCESNF